ncbi:MAG: sensor domain-containing diguanylate cyclase [Pirellulaceae bacterium]
MDQEKFNIRIEDLPSPPSVAVELLNLFGDPDVTIDQIANIISVDPALCAKIIAYCNSPLFGVTREIETFERAIVTLGMNSVRMLALSFSLVEMGGEDDDFDYGAFWNKSLALAVALKTVMKYCDPSHDDQFLTGLMMNIGEVAMYRDQPTLLKEGTFESLHTTIDFDTQQMQTDRFAVGSQLLETWKFPEAMSSCIGKASLIADLDDDKHVRSMDLAWRLAAILRQEDPSMEQVDACKSAFVEMTAVDAESLEGLVAEMLESWQQYAELLELKTETGFRSFRDIELAARTRMTEISISQIQSEQQTQLENQELRESVTKDALTGVNNRRAYDEQATRDFAKCCRNNHPFSILVIDIDHFKSCNDTWGHKIGDEALAHVAQVLESQLRDYDMLYRYGGEEFVVTLPECELPVARDVAERLRAAIESEPLRSNELELPLTVSIGVAYTSCATQKTLTELFESADTCLYEAKSRGRNCCVSASPETSVA